MQVFKEDDLVWIKLKKERFLVDAFGKLRPQVDGSFRIVKRINSNAYKVDLSGNYNILATFNATYLSPYFDDLDAPMDKSDASPT